MIRERADHPPEAYSRATDPERFLSLHHRADELLRRLESEYLVARQEGFALRAPPEGVRLARTSIGLVPQSVGAAPIVISFTTFPGIVLYFGQCALVVLPPCGCDACGGTADTEFADLIRIVEGVVAGRFEEQLSGDEVAWRVSSDQGIRGHGNIMSESSGADLIRWEPWPRRVSQLNDSGA